MRLGTRSRLEVSVNSSFTGNMALAGSGGAVLCDECHAVDLSDGTRFENNVLCDCGGAIGLLSPISVTARTQALYFEATRQKRVMAGPFMWSTMGSWRGRGTVLLEMLREKCCY